MPANLSIKEVTAKTWPDFESLFESKGAPSYCWCMAWRATAEEKKGASNAARKQAMKSRVQASVPVGVLGYLDQQPVAWCSVAPSTTYQRLRKDEMPSEDVWSIVCFFVRREYRGRGLTKTILEAAVQHAKKHGAKVVEGYPVDRDSPSYRFMGFVPMFEDAGFQEVARAGTRRHVVRRDLA
ncbi:MAG: GNAT family N-acetyltransferase [Burkholderiaceae bacterium]